MILFIRQAWLVLVLSLCFGVALAGVNSALSQRIRDNAVIARRKAAVEVFVPKDATPAEKKAFVASATAAEETVAVDGVDVTVYRVSADGKQLGWAVPAAGQGYADKISLVVGVSPDVRTIAGLKVLANQETPGLGNKIVGKPFRDGFVGKPARAALTAAKKSSGLADDEIQAITGATISSQAVCDIIASQLNEDASKLSGVLAAQAK